MTGSIISFIQHTVNTPYPVGPVHFYTAELSGELVMFDTGPPTEECRQYIENYIDLDRMKYLFVTHCHPDHFGQIAWLESKGVVPVVSKYDIWKFINIDKRTKVLGENLIRLGCPEYEAEAIRKTIRSFQRSIPFAERYRILEESRPLLDDLAIDFRRCAGHSQSDIVYLVDTFAISGDVLLDDIFQTPLLEIDFADMNGRFSNYHAYCKTIIELSKLQDRVFQPGHRIQIDSVRSRVEFYLNKISQRSKVVAPFVKSGLSVYAIVKQVLPDVDSSSFLGYMKISEIAFLVDYLTEPELLDRAWSSSFSKRVDL